MKKKMSDLPLQFSIPTPPDCIQLNNNELMKVTVVTWDNPLGTNVRLIVIRFTILICQLDEYTQVLRYLYLNKKINSQVSFIPLYRILGDYHPLFSAKNW